jgi:hypothetical protein
MTPATPLASRSKQAKLNALFVALALGFVVLAFQVWFWHIFIQHDYFPVGDEFALLTNSTRVFHASPLSWITHGFSGYFAPYPDLSYPYSNFIRPVDNAVFFLASIVFAGHWSCYLLANYLFVAGVVSLASYISLAILDLSLGISILIALATAFSPAFTAQVAYRPSFAFDYLAGVFVLISVYSLAQRRPVVAWLSVCCAVFTKEPAFFTPVVACLFTYFILRGNPILFRLTRATVFLLPLAGMLLLRVIDFPDIAGVYVATDSSPFVIVKHIALALTHWPYMLPGEQHIFDHTIHNVSSLTLSVILWLLLITAVRYFAIPVCRLPQTHATGSSAVCSAHDKRFLVALFLFGSLVMPLCFDLTPRFGAASLPLFFMLLGCLIKDATMLPSRLALAVLILMTVLDMREARKILSADQIAHEHVSWALSRGLIHTISETQIPVVFLVDDLSEGFSSPEYMSRFSGYTGKLVPISSLGLGICTTPPVIHASRMGMQKYSIYSEVSPACGSNALLAAYRLDLVSQSDLDRDLSTVYVRYHAEDRPKRKEEFLSQRLTMDLTIKVPRFAILLPDLRSKNYVDITSSYSTSIQTDKDTFASN